VCKYAYLNSIIYTDPDGLNPIAGCAARALAGPFGCGVGSGIGIGFARMLTIPGDTTGDSSANYDDMEGEHCEDVEEEECLEEIQACMQTCTLTHLTRHKIMTQEFR